MIDFFTIADYVGTCAFAISGTLSATEKRLDLFGASAIGFVTAVGGGSLRDVLIGNVPVTWLSQGHYVVLIFSSVVFTFLFHKYVLKLKQALFLFDTIGIGVFTIIGLEKGLDFGLSNPAAVLMGLSSAVMGGVLRDTLCNDVPIIFHKEIYATACLFGCLVFLVLKCFISDIVIVELITIASIIAVRIFAVRYKLSMPVIKV